MSFVRLTPETAFPRALQLIDELSAVVGRAEKLVALPTIADGLQQARGFGEAPRLEVALCMAAPLNPSALVTVLRWLAPGLTTAADTGTQATTLPTSLSGRWQAGTSRSGSFPGTDVPVTGPVQCGRHCCSCLAMRPRSTRSTPSGPSKHCAGTIPMWR